MQGKCVWFNNAKGFGFLRGDGETTDVFCHFSAIVADGYKQLIKDQRVEFDVVQGEKGLQADAVKVIG